VVQFNTWTDNTNAEAVLAWLDTERPDIAVLEENSRGLRRAIAAHPAWQVVCRSCGVIILSRKPALSSWTAPGGRKSPLTEATFRDALGPFVVIGAHNAWPTDIADQQFQERRLAELIGGQSRERLIVTGDFNSAPWSFSRRRWDQAFGLIRRERAVATWPAHAYHRLRWPGLPFLPIDHVYAGPGWATVSIRRGPRLTSDHYPLVVTLAPVARR